MEVNPIKTIRTFQENRSELTYLEKFQLQELFYQLSQSRSPQALIIAKVCLATGARWSEANNLTKSDINTTRVFYRDTKSGNDRSVPISRGLFNQVKRFANKSGNRLFDKNYAFRGALNRCSFDLPKGQKTHVLRHTFASHYIMNGGDILSLQKILGHSDIKMTMVYAHLSPQFINQVLDFNPLNDFDLL